MNTEQTVSEIEDRLEQYANGSKNGTTQESAEIDKSFSRWFSLPLFAFIAAIFILEILDIRTVFEPAWLIPLINGLVFVGASLVAVVLASKAYLTGASRVALSMTSGMVMFGAACLLGSVLVGKGHVNTAVTTHNILSLVAGLILLIGALDAGLNSQVSKHRTHHWQLIVSLSVCVMIVVAVTTLAIKKYLPSFVTPEGTTLLRTVVLSFTVAVFLSTALIFFMVNRYVRTNFLRWYWLGLAMIAVGLAGVAMAKVGTPLSWVGRISQALGQVYIVAGLVTLARRTRGDSIGIALNQVFGKLKADLQESKDRWQTLASLTNEGIIIHRDGIVLDANEQFARMHGYELHEVLGKPIKIFIVPEDQERVHQSIASGEDQVGEYHSIRKDGSVFIVEAHGHRIIYEGNEARVTILRDITKRKKAEEALRESREGLKHAQAVAHTGSWRMDVVNDELIWSEETYRMFGIPVGAPMNYQAFVAAIHPDDREYVDQKWQAALRGEPYDIEHRIAVGSELKWVRERAELIFDKQGQLIGGFGTVQDITELKKAEEALRESEERYRQLVQNTTAIVLQLDTEARVVFANARALEFFGYSEDELIGKHAIGTIVPEKETTGRDLAQMVDQIIAKPDQFQSNINENMRKNGERVWLEWTNSGIYDREGKPTGFLSVGIDITDKFFLARKTREVEEAQALSTYTRELIELSPDPMVTFGIDGKILDVNKATEKVTGFSREELIGSDFSTYFTNPKKAKRGYRLVFSQGTVRDYALTIRHASGQETEVLYSATVYKGEDGQVKGVFAAARDITEYKKIRELEHQEELEMHKLNFYRQTIQAATGGKLLMTDREEIDQITGEALDRWELTEIDKLRFVRADVAEAARSAGMDEDTIMKLLTCVGEATSNALKHVGAGSISVHRKDDRFLVRVDDNGSGIEALNLPDVVLTVGYSTVGTGGLGYKMMIISADKVYLSTGPEGTTIAFEFGLN